MVYPNNLSELNKTMRWEWNESKLDANVERLKTWKSLIK